MQRRPEMGSGEGKPAAAGKGGSVRSWAQRHVNLGFVAGFVLVLLAYTVVSQQFAVASPAALAKMAPASARHDEEPRPAAETGTQGEKKVESTPDAAAAAADRQKLHDDAAAAADRQKLHDDAAAADRQKLHDDAAAADRQKLQDDDDAAAAAADRQKLQDEEDAAAASAAAASAAADLQEEEEARQVEEQEWRPRVAEEPTKRDEAVAEPSEVGKLVCNKHGPFSDTCDVDGDVRTNGTAHSVKLVPAAAGPAERREWKILPYTRPTMSGIPEVAVTQLASSAAAAAPRCTIRHDVPAIVFALGGLTGNYWHDFSDVLVPLFVASRRYGGEVQLLVSNIQPWWLGKYQAVVRRLSRYDAVDFDRDGEVRCFPHVTVGLRMHKEFSITPEWAPGGRLSMVDFTRFLRETYALPRAAPTPPDAKKPPRLMLIHRGHYRKFVNVPEIVAAAEKAGFEVVVMDPRFDVRVEELARSVNSFDVLLGVHGAGLTNAVFLPAGAVVIQVVPYGKLEPLAKVDFGDPVADMGLRYLEYSITAEESTLLGMLGAEHPVIKDPDSVHRSGWDKVAEYYLGKQDVRLDVDRFAPTLALALDHLRRH